MKVHCMKCGKLLAEADANHPKGRVKCVNCKAKLSYKLMEDGSMRIKSRVKDLPCNNVVDIIEITAGI